MAGFPSGELFPYSINVGPQKAIPAGQRARRGAVRRSLRKDEAVNGRYMESDTWRAEVRTAGD